MSYWDGVRRSTWSILVSLDQMGNVVIGLLGALVGIDNQYGNPDETISSVLGRRAYTGRLRPWERPLVWALDRIDENHVMDAIEWGVVNRQRMLSAPRRTHSEGD